MSWQPAITAFLREHLKWVALVAMALPVVFMGWSNYSAHYAQYLKEGQTYLNIGRYDEAQTDFQQAVDWHPLRRIFAFVSIFGDKAEKAAQQTLDLLDLGSEAQWGLEKTRVFESADRIKTEKTLKQFEKQHPDDADVHTFWGKFYLSEHDFQKAAQHFNAAKDINADAADAYFGLCEIYDLQNDLELALAMCEKAIQVSGTTPSNYAVNLAGLYVQKGMYNEALKLLKGLEDKYLIVKFELAKLYQLTHELKAAAKLQEQVLQGLNDADTVKSLENREAWYFKTDTDGIVLTKLEDKKCYVTLSLAASYYLQGEQKKAREFLQQAALLNTPNDAKIKKQLLFDLNLAQKNGAKEKQVEAFKKALYGNR